MLAILFEWKRVIVECVYVCEWECACFIFYTSVFVGYAVSQDSGGVRTTAITTPIQQDLHQAPPPYGRRRGGKPSSLATSFGLQFFPEDGGAGAPEGRGLASGLLGAPGARPHPPLLLHGAPCCSALPLPVTQSHNIGRPRIYLKLYLCHPSSCPYQSSHYLSTGMIVGYFYHSPKCLYIKIYMGQTLYSSPIVGFYIKINFCSLTTICSVIYNRCQIRYCLFKYGTFNF